MEPDTDAAFMGEAEIDATRIAGRATDKGISQVGEENTLVSKGGIGSHLVVESVVDDSLFFPTPNNDPSDDRGSGHEMIGGEDFDGLPWYKRPSIFWMLGPFVVMTLAFGGIITPKLNLFLNLICREYISERKSLDPSFTFLPIVFDGENPQCRIPEVQSRVSLFTLYANLIAGLLSAITSPRLGALSDRYGRTKILAVTGMATIVGEIITILVAKNPDNISVNWIFIGFAVEGLCGSFVCALAISNAYAADLTTPATRNIAFAYFHGCLFLGIAIGPVLAGFIVKWTGSPLSMFYISLGVHVAFALFVAFIVPESLSKSRQLSARKKHHDDKVAAGPSSDWIDHLRAINLLEPLKVLWPTGEGTSAALRRNLVFLAAVDTILFGVAMGSMTVVIYYSNYQFGWGSFESGIFLSIVNTCRVLCLIVILPLVTRYVRGKAKHVRQRSSGSDEFDLSVIRVAVFFDTLGYVGYTLARTGPLLVLSACVASIGGIGSPTLQAALTKHVPPHQTGQLLGASGLLHALARVVAPTLFNGIYAASVGKFTQLVFVFLAATFFLAFILSWFLKPHIRLGEGDEAPPPQTYRDDPVEAEEPI